MTITENKIAYENVIRGKTFDEERALYHLQDTLVDGCAFAGPADGESALKESRRVTVHDCRFSLRYPLWHTHTFRLEGCTMDEFTRAALWYSTDGSIEGCVLGGIKCLRECEDIRLCACVVSSPEFGWRCRGVSLEDCDLTAQYCLFESRDLAIRALRMSGKYSFQYTENVTIEDAVLDTKDAFWHAKNVTVKNSVVKGEYLGWYSDGLTLIGCTISGTQPLCYCKNLKLIDCTMENTDLSFEYSDVEADIRGEMLSVKNPHSGHITADRFGEVILEDAVMESTCVITARQG